MHGDYMFNQYSQSMVDVQSEISTAHLKYTVIDSLPNSGTEINWTRFNDRLLLCYFLISPIIFLACSVVAVLFSGFFGGILHHSSLSNSTKEFIATNMYFGLVWLFFLYYLIKLIFYPAYRRGTGQMFIQNDIVTIAGKNIAISEISRIKYHGRDVNVELTDEELEEIENLWWLPVAKLFIPYDILLELTNGECIEFHVHISDGPKIVNFLSKILEKPSVLDWEKAGVEHNASKTSEYDDWDNKSFGRWIFDYVTKFFPRLIIGFVILYFVGTGVVYVNV
jgi:hypothetical protein